LGGIAIFGVALSFKKVWQNCRKADQKKELMNENDESMREGQKLRYSEHYFDKEREIQQIVKELP
jgi:hypothetical protein